MYLKSSSVTQDRLHSKCNFDLVFNWCKLINPPLLSRRHLGYFLDFSSTLQNGPVTTINKLVQLIEVLRKYFEIWNLTTYSFKL